MQRPVATQAGEKRNNVKKGKPTMNRLLATTISLLPLFSLSGCAFPVVDRLLDSADRGIELARQNDEALFKLFEQKLDADLQRIHGAFDSDVNRIAQDPRSTSGGLSPDWVREAGRGYAYLLQDNFEQQLKLAEMRQTARGNLDMTAKLVGQARQLNQMMLTHEQRLGMLLDRYAQDASTRITTSSQGATHE